MVTVVDGYNKYTWICHSKYEVVDMLTDFICLIKNQFETTIKILRSDNGTEFFYYKYAGLLSSHGIIHQSSWPYTPQQNGTVERKHKQILEVARALRF